MRIDIADGLALIVAEINRLRPGEGRKDGLLAVTIEGRLVRTQRGFNAL
jgi:hypothetical protein